MSTPLSGQDAKIPNRQIDIIYTTLQKIIAILKLLYIKHGDTIAIMRNEKDSQMINNIIDLLTICYRMAQKKTTMPYTYIKCDKSNKSVNLIGYNVTYDSCGNLKYCEVFIKTPSQHIAPYRAIVFEKNYCMIFVMSLISHIVRLL